MGIRIRMGCWAIAAGLALLAATPAPSPAPKPLVTPQVLASAPPTKTSEGLTFSVQTDLPVSSGPFHCVFNQNITLNGIFATRAWICTPIESPLK